ncbi:OmpA family protein [uncultured Algibacter sp.]|uniref:OmpA family protein n=1 Tax=uncultured Algibacter sp. TaxID=298659 RepID=UPI00262EDBD6|nr:OmpA family protein [uncultured Algibacter sp.]
MKAIVSFFICLICSFSYSQGTSNSNFNINKNLHDGQINSNIGSNGFSFELIDAGINTKYSEIGSDIYRDKIILVSTKKIGGVAKIDPNTGEAFKELFRADISANGSLSRPLLFSKILNSNNSEDNLTFSPDQQTVYYTRSSKENSLEFKLYKAELQENTIGIWINHALVSFNEPNISIETPFVNKSGDKLYFSANFPDAIGGYDLYVSNINADGTLSAPKNLGNTINTVKDEKYPALSLDGKHLFFSSKGHENLGGYDVFRSRISKSGFSPVINLGNTINSSSDEIAYFLAGRNKGYVTSNRQGGKGGYDIYTATNDDVIQILSGNITDKETQINLPNTLVVLEDIDGEEIARTTSNEQGVYKFDVAPYEKYILKTSKDGFKDESFSFFSNVGNTSDYEMNLELVITEPVIAEVNDKLQIVLENIYFDFNKWNVKEESTISLNKIVKVLKENLEMKLMINAHTDNKGRESYNLNLSNKRAASAVKYILSKGISQDRLQSKGYGETQPLIDCKSDCSDDDLQANRRIEFVILE